MAWFLTCHSSSRAETQGLDLSAHIDHYYQLLVIPVETGIQGLTFQYQIMASLDPDILFVFISQPYAGSTNKAGMR